MSKLIVNGLVYHHLGPFSLTVEARETVALAGPSGAGKSLFLRALADLDPHGGEILLDGRSSQSWSGPEWRRRVALLPAESQWWHDKVGEHFNRSPVNRSSASARLAVLGFEAQVMNWSIARLSSGEKQRLAILRLLQNQPTVLLLDEPTANLDPLNTQRVEKLFLDYQQQHAAAMVWVTHDLAQGLRLGGRHFQIENGQLELVGKGQVH
ncbi:MAG: ABC transporter ATP-binding protein [Deltaproteobacteria bacterium]|nr:ABC transporter ATP-binding protein [Deltaproteobacteria bacterium]